MHPSLTEDGFPLIARHGNGGYASSECVAQCLSHLNGCHAGRRFKFNYPLSIPIFQEKLGCGAANVCCGNHGDGTVQGLQIRIQDSLIPGCRHIPLGVFDEPRCTQVRDRQGNLSEGGFYLPQCVQQVRLFRVGADC